MLFRFFAVFTRFLSTITGLLVSLEQPRSVVQPLISLYSRIYRVDLSQASKEIKQYKSLQEFFLRDLHAELRPIPEDCKNSVLSPADATLREIFEVQQNIEPNVKGLSWNWQDLLVNPVIYNQCLGATCFNLYLSPSDYHHVHVPHAAKLIKVLHQPGTLLPVNDWSLKLFPNLFCLNERVVLKMQAENFEYIMVLVGALNVGSIKLESLPEFARSDFSFATKEYHQFTKTSFKAGERIASFRLGSSLLLILPQQLKLNLAADLQQAKLKYGQQLAIIS